MRLLLLLWLFCAPGPMFGQEAPPRLLSGQVVGGGQQPLIGVSVFVKGTTLATTTNAEGRFLLEKAPPGDYTLRFEQSGFLTTDVLVTDTTRLPLRVLLRSTRPPVRRR